MDKLLHMSGNVQMSPAEGDSKTVTLDIVPTGEYLQQLHYVVHLKRLRSQDKEGSCTSSEENVVVSNRRSQNGVQVLDKKKNISPCALFTFTIIFLIKFERMCNENNICTI